MTIDPTVGSFDYTPAVGYVGADSFVYTVTNSFGATATATVNVTVTSAGTVTTSVAASGNSIDTTAPYTVSSTRSHGRGSELPRLRRAHLVAG